MGSQVSNWLYEKKDYALRALNTWTHTIFTGANADEILAKLSTEGSINVTGSELITADGDFELILRPYSHSLGGDYGSKTGCMLFNITTGTPYNAKINGLCGTISLDEIIKQTFIACGVIVDGEHMSEYLDAVRLQMGYLSTPKHVSVAIKEDNGLLIGHVPKTLIQNIINAMDAAGMLGEEYWGSDIPPVNSGPFDISDLDYSEGHNLSMIPNYARTVQTHHQQSGYEDYDMGVKVMELLNSELSGVDYDFICVFLFPGANDFRCFYRACKIDDNTGTFFSGSPVFSGQSDLGVYIASSYISTVKSNCYYFEWGSWHWVSLTPGDMFIGQGIRDDYGYAIVSTLNSNVHYIPPEGIEYEEGATVPTPSSHSINTVYPSWATISQQTVNPSTKNMSSRTMIAMNFSGTTQYNTQTGVVTSNEALQHLGIYIEGTDVYEPVNPSSEDDVIIPDPLPSGNDTPEAEFPDSNTPASKYMVSVWNMTDGMVQNFASALWSNNVWNAIKDFFTKPTDAVIAMFTLYGVDVGSGASSEEIKLGGHGTGVSAIPVTTRYKTVDLGSVSVPEFYTNVEDYAPYSSAEIYLPFIGFVKVDVNEIMNATVNIKYVFDMWTGTLVARIFVTKDGIKQELYNFTGCSSVQIPLTDRDYTNAISSLITGTFDTLRNVAIAGGIAAATGGTGLVPALTGIAGGLNTLGGFSQGVKNSVQRSGSIGSTFGAMTNKKACIYIKRPLAYNANNYQHYYGFPANWTCTLSEVSGYTRVKDIHLDTVSCTDEERIEIERILKSGVML